FIWENRLTSAHNVGAVLPRFHFDLAFQVEEPAGGRKPRAPTSGDGAAASGWGTGSSHELRSAIPRSALPLVSVDPAGARYRSTGDRCSLASGRLSLLLALEITFSVAGGRRLTRSCAP